MERGNDLRRKHSSVGPGTNVILTNDPNDSGALYQYDDDEVDENREERPFLRIRDPWTSNSKLLSKNTTKRTIITFLLLLLTGWSLFAHISRYNGVNGIVKGTVQFAEKQRDSDHGRQAQSQTHTQDQDQMQDQIQKKEEVNDLISQTITDSNEEDKERHSGVNVKEIAQEKHGNEADDAPFSVEEIEKESEHFNQEQEPFNQELKPSADATEIEPNQVPARIQVKKETDFSETKHTNQELREPIIPRIIHQSWKTKSRIPNKFKNWMRTWKTFHSEWQYVFWDDEDNLHLFEKYFPQYLPMVSGFSKICLADVSRYALLYLVGGVYADADFECLGCFDPMLSKMEKEGKTLILSSEPKAHTVLLENRKMALCNAIMISAPRHVFWLRLLEEIRIIYESGNRQDAVSLTGPRMVQFTYEKHAQEDSSLVIVNEDYFFPEIAYWNIGSMKQKCRERHDEDAMKVCEWLHNYPKGEHTNHTIAVHHWECTWCRGENENIYVELDAIFHEPIDHKIMRPDFASKTLSFKKK